MLASFYVYRTNSSGPLLSSPAKNMALIPSGRFWMGVDDHASNTIPAPSWAEEDAKPRHEVNLPAFYIDRYEVSYGAFRKLFPEFSLHGREATFPVTDVSWFDADRYCRAVGKRLPTEEEWEKAARGTDERLYPWGNEFDQHKTNLDLTLLPVGSRSGDQSPFGVLDMSGNVSEWTDSWYRPYAGNLYHSPEFGLTHKVVRGGAYAATRHYEKETFGRITSRYAHSPQDSGPDAGFRCALSLEERVS